MNKLVVKKWWGENAAEFKKSPDNVLKDFKKKIDQIIVVSAVRSPEFNSTDKFIELWEELSKDIIDEKKVIKIINKIRDFHLELLIIKLLSTRWDTYNGLYTFFEELKYDIFYYILHRDIFPSKENDYLINTVNGSISILWFWEKISAFIQKELINWLSDYWLSSENIDLDDFVTEYDLYLTESELFLELSNRISKVIKNILDGWKIPIVPGYIWWFVDWIENTIWRGYTDVTASMVAFWFSDNNEVILEIQKSVRWLLSCDPRLLDNSDDAKLLPRLDYLTTKEIIWVRWAQAKLLNSGVLRRELQEANISIKLFDPFEKWEWTIISNEKDNSSSWVEYIWWREKIISFTVSSWKMDDAGILFKVFQVVKDYTSVDIISTSETEISFTIYWWMSKHKLDLMSEEIREIMWIKQDNYENFVKYDINKALVFCVGQNLSNSLWSLWRAAIVLGDWKINIEMVSQWKMERAMVFCIDQKDFKKAINLLHNEFIL